MCSAWRPTLPDVASPASSHFWRTDRTTTFTGDIVVVACGAVNSAALLLRSRGDRHPDGLANSSGVVGRHYMRHNNDALMTVSKEPNPTQFQKTLAMNDWYLGSDDWDYPLGGIQMLGKSDDEEIRAQAPRWAGKISPDLPFEVLAHHAVDIWLCGEDLPQADNRVTVDAEGAIHLSIDEKNNVEGVKRLRHKLDGMLSHLGMQEHHLLDRSLYLHKSMPIGATAHQAGTVRFGTDPAASALDVELQSARRRQPLRRGHQLLPKHRRREPVPDRHRERLAGRRSHHRTARLRPKAAMDDHITPRRIATRRLITVEGGSTP